MSTIKGRLPVRLGLLRTQIALIFGTILILTLIIIAVNYLALVALRADIQATVQEASRVRELGLSVQNEFLQARQQEALFLDQWRSLGYEIAVERYLTANQSFLDQARNDLSELDLLVETSSGSRFNNIARDAAQLAPLLADYESAFLATVAQIEERSKAGGVERQLQRTQDELEDSVGALADDSFIRVVLQMSANEQAYFNTTEQQFVDRTRLLSARFSELIDNTPESSWNGTGLMAEGLQSLMDEHMGAFSQLVVLESDIGINAAIFEEVTADIEERTSAIGQEASEILSATRDRLQTALRRSTIITVIAGALIIGMVGITVYFMTTRVAVPLSKLTMASHQIGRGNLGHRLDLRGNDEFATLGRVFNQMTTQMGGMIDALEQNVAERSNALQASIEISRRLSRILDREELASEIVEQVRSAFDYYHVQMYLRDQSGESLRFAGGTGEVGHSMLAEGHRIDFAEGLIGEAASTGETILVPDASQEPGWLSNPLLPETKSEVAVPIRLGDTILGVLDVQSNKPDGLKSADVAFLESVAGQVAIAIRNAELYEAAQKRADREARINVINQKIIKSASIEKVLQIAADELGRALSARRAVVQLNPESRPQTSEEGDGATGDRRISGEVS